MHEQEIDCCHHLRKVSTRPRPCNARPQPKVIRALAHARGARIRRRSARSRAARARPDDVLPVVRRLLHAAAGARDDGHRRRRAEPAVAVHRHVRRHARGDAVVRLARGARSAAPRAGLDARFLRHESRAVRAGFPVAPGQRVARARVLHLVVGVQPAGRVGVLERDGGSVPHRRSQAAVRTGGRRRERRRTRRAAARRRAGRFDRPRRPAAVVGGPAGRHDRRGTAPADVARPPSARAGRNTRAQQAVGRQSVRGREPGVALAVPARQRGVRAAARRLDHVPVFRAGAAGAKPRSRIASTRPACSASST